MKMKKNNLTLILVLVVALTLITAATVAASSTNVGYETFKTTMEDINHEGAGAGKVTVRVTDNGQEIFTVDADTIGTKDEENFSAEAVIGDGDNEKAFELYGIDGSVYIIDVTEGAYYMADHDDEMMEEHDRSHDDDHSMTSVEEELLDYFVGDLKDNFSVTEEDNGSKVLEFSMEESEVPTGLNLMIKAAAAADHRSDDFKDDDMEDMPFFDGLSIDGKPDIVEDAALKAVDVTVKVNPDDQVEAMDFSIVMTGLDADGTFHEIAVTVEAEMTYEDLEPATIDPSDYEWEVVEDDDYKHNRGRR